MNEPEKIWLLWRDGQGTTDRLVASEIDHSDEGFPEYVRVDLLDAANAKIKRLRALLREGE